MLRCVRAQFSHPRPLTAHLLPLNRNTNSVYCWYWQLYILRCFFIWAGEREAFCAHHDIHGQSPVSSMRATGIIALLRVYNCLVIYTNIPARDPGHCPRAGFNAFWLHLKQHDHWVSGIIIYLLCNELLHAWNNWFKLIKRYKKE